jgi:hypothetical protein
MLPWIFHAETRLDAELSGSHRVATIASRVLLLQPAGLAGLDRLLQCLTNEGCSGDTQFIRSPVRSTLASNCASIVMWIVFFKFIVSKHR